MRKLDSPTTSAKITRDEMMPSVREWFDARANDETAPCDIKGHPQWCEIPPCANPNHGHWTHTRTCGGSGGHHSRRVRLSGMGKNLMTEARARLRKAVRESLAA